MTAKTSHELYTGIGVVLLSILGYFVAIPAGIVVPESVDIRALSPDFWPVIVVFVLGLSGVGLTVQGLAETGLIGGRKRSKDGDQIDRRSEDTSDEYTFGKAALRVVVFMVILFAIYFAIPFIGMVAATIPAIMFLSWYAGEKRWKIIIPLAVVLPLILYFFFVYVANVPIPNGIFESIG